MKSQKSQTVATESRWHNLTTEAANPRTRNIDALAPREMIALMVDDHQRAIDAVRREVPRLALAAGKIASAVNDGRRLFFVGAGTSGRLGVIEAAELPPTFGIDPAVAVSVIAGDREAVFRSKEHVEDSVTAGRRAIDGARPGRGDVVIGISASGMTPFVRAALRRARARGAVTVTIACNRRSPLDELGDVAIRLRVGPEVIAGSTRMKAGTATKIALNLLTTAAMILAGKTYGPLMVDVRATSAKLRDRALRILTTATGRDRRSAAALLKRAGGSVKTAIVMHQLGLSRSDAAERLRTEPRLRRLLGSVW